MIESEKLKTLLQLYRPGKVVDFDVATDHLVKLDFTSANTDLTTSVLSDTTNFCRWIEDHLREHNARYGVGGYGEHRTIYSLSSHFNTEDEPRRLHLGVDIWGPAGTAVYCPLNATIHSFKYNQAFGDYGATIILAHQLDDFRFYTLYGHLNLKSIERLEKRGSINKGTHFSSFGNPFENGGWPPHLHFQLILDMQGQEGDYPGVCKFSERDVYLNNCPDPDLILRSSFE